MSLKAFPVMIAFGFLISLPIVGQISIGFELSFSDHSSTSSDGSYTLESNDDPKDQTAYLRVKAWRNDIAINSDFLELSGFEGGPYPVEPGFYTLRLTRNNYHPYEAVVEFSEGFTTELIIDWERTSGSVLIDMEPMAEEVAFAPVDSGPIWESTEDLGQLYRLDSGDYRFRLRRFGFEDVLGTISVSPESTVVIRGQWTRAEFELSMPQIFPDQYNPNNPGYLGTLSMSYEASGSGTVRYALEDQGITLGTSEVFPLDQRYQRIPREVMEKFLATIDGNQPGFLNLLAQGTGTDTSESFTLEFPIVVNPDYEIALIPLASMDDQWIQPNFDWENGIIGIEFNLRGGLDPEPLGANGTLGASLDFALGLGSQGILQISLGAKAQGSSGVPLYSRLHLGYEVLRSDSFALPIWLGTSYGIIDSGSSAQLGLGPRIKWRSGSITGGAALVLENQASGTWFIEGETQALVQLSLGLDQKLHRSMALGINSRVLMDPSSPNVLDRWTSSLWFRSIADGGSAISVALEIGHEYRFEGAHRLIFSVGVPVMAQL